jgi:demethylmenaquinone methyltransferase/2-methoxy-6-polyprenyl-1,4-benzoquinol methylase
MRVDAHIATPDGKARYVRALFATIADRYDLITRLLSYGQDARWKRRLVALVDALPGARALDLASGTGDIAFLLGASGLRTIGLDITPRMIEHARRRSPRGGPVFLVGDMNSLPFPAASFDVVTTGYGLRNVVDLQGAIDEIHRVLKPDGQLLSLDFDRPSNGALRSAYLTYLRIVGGVVGWMLHRDPDTYRYIPASIVRYPGAAAVAALMRARGFSSASHMPVLGGLMAIHCARKEAPLQSALPDGVRSASPQKPDDR